MTSGRQATHQEDSVCRTIDCTRKRAYQSHHDAEEVARHQMDVNFGLVLRVYQCDRCGMFHLTHKPRRF